MASLGASAVLTVNLPPALVLISATVEAYGDVPGEGQLVRLIDPARRAILKLLDSDPDALRKIPPRDLEQLVAASYDADGYDEVILTPRSGDGGRDVIATKNGMHSIRIFDQVKQFAADRHVTAHDVRAMLGILHGNVSKGVVTTTATFAPGIASDPSDGLAVEMDSTALAMLLDGIDVRYVRRPEPWQPKKAAVGAQGIDKTIAV